MMSRLPRGWGYAVVALVVGLVFAWLPLNQSLAQVSRSFPLERLRAYQLANLSWPDEIALGEAIDRYLKQDGLVTYDQRQEVSTYVNRVGDRIVAASQYPVRRYRFQVVDDDGINAFATAGGYVYVQLGLLNVIQNEAELAGVLAHEVGHIEGQDGLNQLWHQLTVQELSQHSDRMRQRMAVLGGQLRSLSNGQASEYAADTLAFYTLGRAGYAQLALVTLLQRVIAVDPAQAPRLGLVSSHPNPQSRIEQLQRRLATEPNLAARDGLEPDSYRTVRALFE